MTNEIINGILSKNITVTKSDVYEDRILKMSRLFDYFQDIANEHVELLGCGSDKTADRGILWVLASQQVSINRMPRQGESLILKTWPGRTRLNFFPRHYMIEDTNGEPLLESVSMWGLINADTRELVNPDDYDIYVEPVEIENELKMKGGPKPIECTSHSKFIVPPEYIDGNVHLNNARYLDIVYDNMTASILEPKFINARYGQESLEGEHIIISSGTQDDSYYASIDNGDINHFKLRIDY